jgi:hypothetical protein
MLIRSKPLSSCPSIERRVAKKGIMAGYYVISGEQASPSCASGQGQRIRFQSVSAHALDFLPMLTCLLVHEECS